MYFVSLVDLVDEISSPKSTEVCLLCLYFGLADMVCIVGYSSNFAETLIKLKEELMSCKIDNDRIMQAQKKQA